MGVFITLFLLVGFVLAYLLKKEYWKDVTDAAADLPIVYGPRSSRLWHVARDDSVFRAD